MDSIPEEYIMNYKVWCNHRWYYTRAKSAAEAKRKVAHQIQARAYEHRTVSEIMKGMKAEKDV